MKSHHYLAMTLIFLTVIWVIKAHEEPKAATVYSTLSEFEHFDTLLELVEDWASYEKLISSEKELSDKFDEVIRGLSNETFFTMKGDKPMISEEFSSFTDNLAADGQLHAEQVKNYCYINDFSNIR